MGTYLVAHFHPKPTRLLFVFVCSLETRKTKPLLFARLSGSAKDIYLSQPPIDTMCCHSNRNLSPTRWAHVVKILIALTTIGKWANPPPFPYRFSYLINPYTTFTTIPSTTTVQKTDKPHHTVITHPLHSHTSPSQYWVCTLHYTPLTLTHLPFTVLHGSWYTPSWLHPLLNHTPFHYTPSFTTLPP